MVSRALPSHPHPPALYSQSAISPGLCPDTQAIRTCCFQSLTKGWLGSLLSVDPQDLSSPRELSSWTTRLLTQQLRAP